MAQEYIIRRIETDEQGYRKEFTIPVEKFWEIMSPNSWGYTRNPDMMEIVIPEFQGKVGYSWEMGFIHVFFESGKFPDEVANKMMEEIYQNILASTNQDGELIETV